MSNIVQFNNIGYLFDTVPTDLFCKLKSECAVAEMERYHPSGAIPEAISGLTTGFVPKHYYIRQNLTELNDFIIKLFCEKFNKEFNYLSEFTMLTNNVPLICNNPWINIQEKHEFVPNHRHDGIVSFVIWIKIPYDIEEELSLSKLASVFSFTYMSTQGNMRNHLIKIDKSFEGNIIMFPSSLQHCVYPFHTVDEKRISISGNISFNTQRADQ